MSVACPTCGSARVVRKGSYAPTFHRMGDGRPVPYRGSVIRILCRGCGRNGTLYDPADVANARRVREHVVRRAFALGQAGAALEAGMERSVLQAHLAAWREPYEGQVADTVPDFLVVEETRVREEACVLVADADRETLVEMARGHDGLAAWLTAPGRPPALRACLPVSPGLHAVVARHLPGARLMVAPSAARRAVRTEGDLALRAMRRRPENYRRNGMPTPAEFTRSLAPGGAAGEGWPTEASRLRSAVVAVLWLLQARSRAVAERILPEVEATASGSSRIARWLATWRGAVLEGLDNAFVDRPARLLREVRRDLARRRPALGLADLRALALLRGFVTRDGPGGRGAVAEGMPLSGIASALS